MELRSSSISTQRPPPVQLGAEAQQAFEEGVNLVLTRWSALVMAVEGQWGGAASTDKANQLIADVTAWFRNNKELYADDLEVDLAEVMLADFNCELEDGSDKEVATALVRLHTQCAAADWSGLEHLRATAGAAAAANRQLQVEGKSSSEEGSDDDEQPSTNGDAAAEMEVEGGAAPAGVPLREAGGRPPPVVDEDGFEVVQPRRRR